MKPIKSRHSTAWASFVPILLCALALAGVSGPATAVELADQPVFSTISVPGNLALDLSVEFPTALSPAYPSLRGDIYAPDSTYIGYFDPEKCYQYVFNSTTPSDSYFTPYGAATSHACTSTSGVPLWSGNYMNWASMGALDVFRSVLTGGYRATDTESTTILQKAYNFNRGPQIRENGDKTISTSDTSGVVAGATPFSDWSSATARVWHQGTAMLITGTHTTTGSSSDAACNSNDIPSYTTHGECVNTSDATNSTATTSPYEPVAATTDSTTASTSGRGGGGGGSSGGSSSSSTFVYYNAQSSAAGTANAAKVYKLYIRVKVCDSSVGIENNCTEYASGYYKPEGLLQKYASKLRYAVFGYLNIPDYTTTNKEVDGGVLRAAMKYIGPTQPVPGSSAITNSLAEWDSTTGVMVTNPDSADASATNTNFSLSDTNYPVTNSGVLNYLNKFGQTPNPTYGLPEYKTYDPVSELYYASYRYFTDQGDVASYYSPLTASTAYYADEFPVIKDWSDPIAYSCQKNFILGIGDTNTNYDGNVPKGNDKTTYDVNTTPTDTTDDGTFDATTWANYVGKIEGTNSKLGTAKISNGTYLIAGLAYRAHTKDIRTDLDDEQTIDTYWMDVQEFGTYTSKNQYWYATKYGGFTVPDDFDPTTATYLCDSANDTSCWYSNSDTLGSTTDKRPDNYFPAADAAEMKTGLTTAFEDIVSAASSASSTTISSPTAKETASGNANYTVTYNPNNWTSTLKGQLVSYDSDGNPTYTDVWNATTLLDERTASNRLIVTCCTDSGAALPFTYSDLTGDSLDSRTYYDAFGAITGVSSSSQSIANYVDYLRGSRTHELSNDGPYRTRSHLLGDIVGSKLTAVGAPDATYYDIYNPGYSAFKTKYADRATVVYVGANDGMMHAFDGTVPGSATGTCTSTLGTPTTACGKELFAYIPSFAYDGDGGSSDTAASTGLASLGNPSSFSHHYLVDATPVTADVDFYNTENPTATTNDWRTLLVGGLGTGGQGYYAIDVTDPSSWTSESAVASKVLWEFTQTHMGYTFGDPVIVKTPEFGWTVILPSGYNNDNGNGYLFFVNPRTGDLLKTITFDGSTTSPLNLAHVQAFVPNDTNFTADALYASDLRGDIWRVDLTESSDGNYDYATVQLASLTDSSGTVQPITTTPLVEIDPTTDTRYVLVGTGQLLSDSDITSPQVQTFYAIIDGTGDYGGFYTADTLPTGISFPITRAVLVANTNLESGIIATSAKPMGWYYDLSVDDSTGIAERINVQPVATSDGIVAFAANLPNGEVCSPAGTSKVYAVSFANGVTAISDSSGDVLDYVSLDYSVTDLSFIQVSGTTHLYVGTSKGTVIKVGTSYSGNDTYKQLNWREVPTAD